ncbi:MAG: hypothetical protein CFE21_00055 [Bacteroidetes bacterium B1(2017)]|nr:MAG: hypothetical protein CFE21_00055 [Bacteroidetes bacterium B1(2017)]
MSNSLVGQWRADVNDNSTMNLYGDIIMEFQPNGNLIYTVFEEGNKSIIYLNYEIVDNYLITDQPSEPKKEITAFRLVDSTLELNYDGNKSVFIRIK